MEPTRRWLRPDDGEAVLVLYETYQDRQDCPPRDVFLGAMRKHELAYMMCGAEVMGVATRRAGVVHVGVLKAWRGRCASRALIRAVLAWAAETGKVWTVLAQGNSRGERLVTGVGFVKKDGGRYELQN